MGTWIDKNSLKEPPARTKKILKRYKPKLMRKKLLEECDTYIYDIDDKEDIEFMIECLKW